MDGGVALVLMAAKLNVLMMLKFFVLCSKKKKNRKKVPLYKLFQFELFLLSISWPETHRMLVYLM